MPIPKSSSIPLLLISQGKRKWPHLLSHRAQRKSTIGQSTFQWNYCSYLPVIGLLAFLRKAKISSWQVMTRNCRRARMHLLSWFKIRRPHSSLIKKLRLVLPRFNLSQTPAVMWPSPRPLLRKVQARRVAISSSWSMTMRIMTTLRRITARVSTELRRWTNRRQTQMVLYNRTRCTSQRVSSTLLITTWQQ